MNVINTCFLTDDGYAMPTCIAINSMIINKNKESIYNIYVLSMNISEFNEEMFKKISGENCNIYIIKLDNNYQKFSMEGVSASPTAINKFSIPEILDNIDKVIYLDGDIVIKSDLSELYQYDLGDNYIGAVKDINGILKRHFNTFVKNNIFYFNSGVMLMNLKKMREDKITEKLIDYRINGYNELMDQDALNFVLRKNVYELPFKYNTQTMFTAINKNIDKLKIFLKLSDDVKSYDDLIKESVILHYSLKSKPWKAQSGYMFDLWLYYYYKSSFQNIVVERKNKNNKKSGNIIVTKIKALAKNCRRYRFFKKFSMN